MERLSLSRFYEEPVMLHLLYARSDADEIYVRIAPKRFFSCYGYPSSFRVEYYDGLEFPPTVLRNVTLPPVNRGKSTIIDVYGFLEKLKLSLTPIPSREFYKTKCCEFGPFDVVSGENGIVAFKESQQSIEGFDPLRWYDWTELSAECFYTRDALRLGEQSVLSLSIKGRWQYYGKSREEEKKRVSEMLTNDQALFGQMQSYVYFPDSIDVAFLRQPFDYLRGKEHYHYSASAVLMTDQARFALDTDECQFNIDLALAGKHERWTCKCPEEINNGVKDIYVSDALYNLVIAVLKLENAKEISDCLYKYSMVGFFSNDDSRLIVECEHG